MIRSLIVAALMMTAGGLLSLNYIGYTNAGERYISKHRDNRKSIRPGSYGYYGTHTYGSGGFRGGK